MRFPRPALTIRARLLLAFVCLVALTAAAIISLTVVIASRDARQRVVGQLNSVATLKEQQIDAWIANLGLNLDIVLSGEDTAADLHLLATRGTRTAEGAAAYDRVQRRFTWVARRMGLFEELFFMDQGGQVAVSTDSGHERQQLGMNDYFVQGLGREFIQEPSYSLSLDKLTVVASCPVVDGGRTVGVLAGRANLYSLNAVMAGRAGLGDTGETYLVGSNHRLLTDLRLPGSTIPDTYVRTRGSVAAVDRHGNGHATYTGYTGEPVIGVYRWIPKLNAALLAEQGEAEALRATRLALWTTGGIALAATALAIVVGMLLIRGIVRPLSELGDTAGRIAAGELDLTARVERDDEIGRLAQAFNRMTRRLRELAAGEERQRLARDLHDAVSQTLFSVSIMAEVLPRIYERDQAEGRRRLEELRQLTRGALAEMRMLLLELRPAALADTSLPDLLRHLAEAVTARARIPVELSVETQADLPPEVRVALYRIAQEALNNVAKHAEATQAQMTLCDLQPEDGGATLELVVRDDGTGFDPSSVGAGRLGLGIMAERAAEIGARLHVESAPGEGTTVRASWPS
jgi:signal transduction histidine kinase